MQVLECRDRRTPSGRVLAKVLGLVPAEDALGLHLGSRSSGEFFVEVDDALHARGTGSATDGLERIRQQLPLMLRFPCLSSSVDRSSDRSPRLEHSPFPSHLPAGIRVLVIRILVISMVCTLGDATC